MLVILAVYQQFFYAFLLKSDQNQWEKAVWRWVHALKKGIDTEHFWCWCFRWYKCVQLLTLALPLHFLFSCTSSFTASPNWRHADRQTVNNTVTTDKYLIQPLLQNSNDPFELSTPPLTALIPSKQLGLRTEINYFLSNKGAFLKILCIEYCIQSQHRKISLCQYFRVVSLTTLYVLHLAVQLIETYFFSLSMSTTQCWAFFYSQCLWWCWR